MSHDRSPGANRGSDTTLLDDTSSVDEIRRGLDVLEYAARGWFILPVRPFVPPVPEEPKGGEAYRASKEPYAGLGIHHSTTDGAAIREWWARWPEARPAVYLRPSGLVALDWDLYKPGALRQRDVIRQLPLTATSVSPQGGQHLIFRTGEGFVPPATVVGQLDVKWDGYIILPAPGSGYRWIDEAVPVAPWPVGTEPARAMGQARSAGPIEVPEATEPAGTTPAVRALLDEEPGVDRSAQTYRFVARLVGLGHSDGEVLWLAARHRPTREKYGDRLTVEVTRAAWKARAAGAEDRPPTIRFISGRELRL